MQEPSLPRTERLRSMRSIRHLFQKGRSGFVYPLRYIYLVETRQSAETTDIACQCENVSERPVQVMFSVPKKFHKRANRRNLHKRRMREAFRLGRGEICKHLCEQNKSLQLALVYSTKESHSYKTINYALQRIFEQISAAM